MEIDDIYNCERYVGHVLTDLEELNSIYEELDNFINLQEAIGYLNDFYYDLEKLLKMIKGD